MAQPGEVQLDFDSGIAIVTLDAPGRSNALSPQMAEELIGAFGEVDARREVGALMVRAEGASFCAGADNATLTAAGEDPAEPTAYDDISAIYESFHRLGQVKVPTVVAARGSAVGAGMNMLLAADLRIVARDIRLICGFLKRGIHPGGGHFVLLSRLVGPEAAAAMALFGAEIDGDRAQELGMAWESVDSDQVEARALEIATRVARDPSLARVAAANFRREVGPPGVPWDVAMQYERPAQMWSMRRR